MNKIEELKKLNLDETAMKLLVNFDWSYIKLVNSLDEEESLRLDDVSLYENILSQGDYNFYIKNRIKDLNPDSLEYNKILIVEQRYSTLEELYKSTIQPDKSGLVVFIDGNSEVNYLTRDHVIRFDSISNIVNVSSVSNNLEKKVKSYSYCKRNIDTDLFLDYLINKQKVEEIVKC